MALYLCACLLELNYSLRPMCLSVRVCANILCKNLMRGGLSLFTELITLPYAFSNYPSIFFLNLL